MERIIPLSVPEISGNEWRYIKECLDTNWVSSAGKYVERFERVVADYLGVRYAVACISGTAALHTALLIAGLRPEDEVLIPALTFIAPANTIRYVGAHPIFIDVQPDTWQMDPQKVKDFLTNECVMRDGHLTDRATARRVKAVLPVHILGYPVDIDPIRETAGHFDLLMIDDAAESLGADYKTRKVGSLSDINCLSFNGNKIITTGGGGMVVTDEREWGDRARYLTTQAKDDPLEFIHNETGYNYRLSNLHAAMGVAQMENLEKYLAAKKKTALYYEEQLRDIPGVTSICRSGWAQPSFWLYTIRIDAALYGMDSRFLLRKMREAGIETRPLWHPLHTLKPFKDCRSYNIEVADELYRECLSLPSSVGIKKDEQDRVIEIISKNREGCKK